MLDASNAVMVRDRTFCGQKCTQNLLDFLFPRDGRADGLQDILSLNSYNLMSDSFSFGAQSQNDDEGEAEERDAVGDKAMIAFLSGTDDDIDLGVNPSQV